jgi:RHS repeat-associated protein
MTESWADQLSSAYGNTYTYDAQGNVLTKTHVQSGHVTSYAWEGRTLVGIVVKDENGVTTQEVTYTYDDQGIRTSKTVDGVLHTYVTDGSRVLVETWGNNTIQYTYDLSGRIISAMINGTEYFYQHNIQGDVTALALSTGVVVVRYVYDAWGNVVSMSGSLSSTIGEINPVRYRGYMQDSETGVHYLQSRYYDPTIGRFISSDGWLGEPGMVLSHNMYVYALNNPVMYSDPSGNFPILAILSLVAIVGMGLTIGGVASDNNALTGIGLTMIAIPALITGGPALVSGIVTGATLTGVIGGGTLLAGLGTGTFATAEFQEASGNGNWIMDSTGISEGLYNGLLLTTAAIATLGTAESSICYSLNIKSISGVGKYGDYYGMKFQIGAGKTRVLSFHTHAHTPGRGIAEWHWQLQKWNPQTGKTSGTIARWIWWSLTR